MLAPRALSRSRLFRPAPIFPLAVFLAVFAYDPGAAQTNYYEGKTLQLIVAFGTGGVTDLSARLVARHLGKHIPGHPNIVVQNMSGAAGITGANHLYNVAKRDGLTVMAMGRANYLDQLVGKPEVRFDFRKFSWIGSFNNAPMMMACRADRRLNSLDQIRASKSPPRIGQGGTSSVSTIFTSLVEEALSVKFHNVMGYQSGREIDLALERGEIDCRASSDITILRSPWPEWLEMRFVSYIVQQGPNRSRVLPAEVPTVHEMASPDAKPVLDLMSVMLAFTEFDRPFAAPPELPARLLQTLRSAFAEMIADPQFSSEAKKLVDWDGSYLSGEKLQKKIEETVSQPPKVISRIKQILQ
jgi:tripartite-type tricarboxylate transporter receptor subunit TctC